MTDQNRAAVLFTKEDAEKLASYADQNRAAERVRVIKTCLWWPLGSCQRERVRGTDLCVEHGRQSRLERKEKRPVTDPNRAAERAGA